MDIESDGEKINQIAFVNKEKEYYFESKKVKEGINELNNLITKNSVIVGHNIKKFDLLVLSKEGVSVDENLVWDTLEIEFLLTPYRDSFALKTEHNAYLTQNLH
jgi:hypothetical protein